MKGIPRKYNLITVILSVLCMCVCACAPVNAPVATKDDGPAGEELINDGDLSQPGSFWGIYQESGGSATLGVSAGELVVKISDPGRVGHAVQLYRDGFELLQGAKYHFSADISSDVSRTMEWRIQVNGGDYHPYVGEEDVQIGPKTFRISCDFTMEEPSDPAPRLCFNLGDADKAQALPAHEIHFDNVSLLLVDDTDAKRFEKTGENMSVNVDQIGYRPGDEKRAVITVGEKAGETFEVKDVNTGKSVYKGELTPGLTGGSSGDRVVYADLSSVNTPGRYMIETAENGSSYEFDIGEDVYDAALKDSLRMLYLQRCGCALPKQLAGDFAHEACHTELAEIYGGEGSIEVSGGWHDAGDYGRYTVPAAKAVADLMLAYEMYPSCFGDDNDIPESGNGIPDILDEARYELEWMLKMQREDGMVYHKVTGLNFDGVCMPDKCTEKLYVLPPSKTATADLAAAMFMAARVYKDIDAAFSARCLDAAERAVDAYIEHKDERNYTNPPDVLTGEYADGNSTDELLWAAAEGYKTTKDKGYEEKLALVDISRIENITFDWANVSGYGLYALLTCEDPVNTSFDPQELFFGMCDELKELCLSKEAYGSTIKDDYPWGSNMTIAN
ncbi:MAG: glycoside hydrolase family 9 protein, partial [Lachnospiraceae bacterium]|nr:glycoside hydrolase family 9 protein [Lachnospiraceae bacterium]